MAGHVAVLDVGKTLTKLTLWNSAGEQVARIDHRNRRVEADGYAALDVDAIRDWLASALAFLARKAPIDAIVPVAHGAAAVVVRDGAILCPPMDYEDPAPAEQREQYLARRDPFEVTGSPALPDGLNLGLQLDRLQRLYPDLLTGGAQILFWPQYWAWVLSGVAASEVTSLGCHTDLWQPSAGKPSPLAVRRKWSDHLPPLRRADAVLGPIRTEWAARTGLSPDVKIYCGIHDSNAALLAARGFSELGGREATVLSTGTWFVAMRSPRKTFDMRSLSPGRDCLVNVDPEGAMVPSVRFMGGREVEILTGSEGRRIDLRSDQLHLVAAAADVVTSGAMILPTFVPGCGPFPAGHGCWLERPATSVAQRAAIGLYIALVADAALDLIGARDRILIEGRFAEAEIFVRALATLRGDDTIYSFKADNDVSFGALRLVHPELRSKGTLAPVAPLPIDLDTCRQCWRRETERLESAA